MNRLLVKFSLITKQFRYFVIKRIFTVNELDLLSIRLWMRADGVTLWRFGDLSKFLHSAKNSYWVSTMWLNSWAIFIIFFSKKLHVPVFTMCALRTRNHKHDGKAEWISLISSRTLNSRLYFIAFLQLSSSANL